MGPPPSVSFPAFELQNLISQLPRLDAESGDARACNYGDPGVIGIGNDFEQPVDTAST
jgi:hypothetical protein